MKDPLKPMQDVFAHQTLAAIAEQAQLAEQVKTQLALLIAPELLTHVDVMFVGPEHVSLMAKSADWLVWLKPALMGLPEQLNTCPALQNIKEVRWKIRAS